MYVVYGLEDPRDHLYHYIGITDDVYARFNQHITGSSGNIAKNGWIWECRQANIMIVMRELERMETVEEAQSRERFWIAYYLNSSHPLHNHAIAKGLLKRREALDRQHEIAADHVVQQRLSSHQEIAHLKRGEVIEDDKQELKRIAEVWHSGANSGRKLAAALDISVGKGVMLMHKLRLNGLI
jgi:predicted GIY-YIG superfamily endonuclease